jgi:cytochrome c oxidase cbb3-type subunit 2
MNSLKSFVLTLGACIGVPTYFMAVRPYAVERERQPVAYQSEPPANNPTAPPADPAELKSLYYPQAYPGDSKRGERVYIREGCAQCHTQVIRPDYAGNDQIKVYGGKEQEYKKGMVPVEVRQTQPWDYLHEDFAMFGQRRIGPDLSNAGYRYSRADGSRDEAKINGFYQYLYAPRSRQDHGWSNSPGFKHLFEVKAKETPEGRADAVRLVPGDELLDEEHREEREALFPADGYEIVPGEDAKALASYIYSLKRAAPIPASITGVKPPENK